MQLLLGAGGLTAAALALGFGAARVTVGSHHGHEFAIAGQRLGYPALNLAAVLLLALAVAGVAAIIRALREVERLVRAQRRFDASIRVLGSVPGHPDALLMEDDVALALCAGYLRPRVLLSSAALERLSPEEVAVVLAHERQHVAARDPLRRACGRVLSSSLFFLPAVRGLARRVEDLSELSADSAALGERPGAAPHMASAMLALGSSLPGGLSVDAERVDRLLAESGDGDRPSGPALARGPAIASALALGAAIVVIWRAGAAASASASLGLPLVSAQPCVLALALIGAAVLVLASTRARRARPGARRPYA